MKSKTLICENCFDELIKIHGDFSCKKEFWILCDTCYMNFLKFGKHNVQPIEKKDNK